MPDALHLYFKSILQNTVNAAVLATLLAGCVSRETRLSAVEIPVEANQQASTQLNDVKPAELQTGAEGVQSASQSGGLSSSKSHWCRYLREDAAAEASVVRSPSLNGSLDDKGRASVGLGVSLTSAMKADLIETSADVKCRRYIAEKGLQGIVLSTPQVLSYAGFRAKASSIAANRGEIDRLRTKISRLLSDGTIDQQRASSLLAITDQIVTDGQEARSEADLRAGQLSTANGNAAIFGRQLVKADAELSAVDSKMRSYDAMDVSLHAGWKDDVNSHGVQVSNDEISGKVSFSMKLGAVTPGRLAHERAAAAARSDAIRFEEGSPIWQANTMRKAYQKSLDGLVESQSQVRAALQRAQTFSRQLEAQGSEDFAVEVIAAKLQVIRMQSVMAGVDASVSEVRASLEKLGEG
jgi:hypothetical protein